MVELLIRNVIGVRHQPGSLVQERVDLGTKFSIIAVSEGARPAGGEQVFRLPGDRDVRGRETLVVHLSL